MVLIPLEHGMVTLELAVLESVDRDTMLVLVEDGRVTLDSEEDKELRALFREPTRVVLVRFCN